MTTPQLSAVTQSPDPIEAIESAIKVMKNTMDLAVDTAKVLAEERDTYKAMADSRLEQLAAAKKENAGLVDALQGLVERVDINGGLGEYKRGRAFALGNARKAIEKALK